MGGTLGVLRVTRKGNSMESMWKFANETWKADGNHMEIQTCVHGKFVEIPGKVMEKEEVREFHELDDLRKLSPGEHIMLSRSSPSYAAGFLDHLIVTNDGVGDILSEIRESWGGGIFTLRPKIRAANGRLLFAAGRSISVQIAGEPLFNGRKYNNGVLEPQSISAQPVVVQTGSSQKSDELQSQLLGIIQSTFANQSAKGGNVDIVGLVGALQEVLRGGQNERPQDSFGDIDRSLGLISKLQQMFGGNVKVPEESSEDTSDAFSFGNMSLEKLLMFKLLGSDMGGMMGGGPPMWQQRPSPYGYPGQPRPNPPQHPGMPTGMPMGYPQNYPQWEPPHPPPRSEHDQRQESMQASESSESDESYDPITVDEIFDDLADRTSDEREKFLGEFFEKIGANPELLRAVMQNIQPHMGANEAPTATNAKT